MKNNDLTKNQLISEIIKKKIKFIVKFNKTIKILIKYLQNFFIDLIIVKKYKKCNFLKKK